jgi:hypothetical protein
MICNYGTLALGYMNGNGRDLRLTARQDMVVREAAGTGKVTRISNVEV